MQTPSGRNTCPTSRTERGGTYRLRAGMLALLAWACASPLAHAAPRARATVAPPVQPPAMLYGLPAACLSHVITAPLLTNSGSPLVPATFNDTTGLAYLSVTQDRVGVYAATELDFPIESIINIQTIAGTDTTYTTVLHSLKLSNGAAQDVPALLIGIGLPHIDTQPVLGVIGYDLLSNYDVLLDFQARRMVLFVPSDAAGCPPQAEWLGPDSMGVPLLPDATGRMTGVALRVGEQAVRMEIEPGADMSSLSRRDAKTLGLTNAILHDDMHVRTNAGKILNGRRHHFDHVALGAWQDLSLDVNVEKTSYSILGMNFLRRRRVLLAFPQDMLFLTPQQDTANDRGQATRGILSTRTAIARMVDTPPPPPGTAASHSLITPAPSAPQTNAQPRP
ncbi:retropepsin-like aspartic protease [Komagataeibacter sp. FNDCF1]|uniref:retropepsin-like aspartic protease n=1 Tax=Komagataeibacter sp. FNDCF1 TaxID=2878681 RepID=UPI001E311F1C|nr:retropepsin-like aspartic protease [Komagataeibacter sp. FNDCF1]MCE2564913.1 retroviral-like aspartic protease family protein [Komagataeibacter sp. FNDCF1]